MPPLIDKFDIINGGKLSSSLYYILRAIKYSGMWPYNHKLYKFYHYSLTLIASSCIVLQIYNIRYIYNDLILLSSNLYIVSSEICAVIKTRIMVRKHRVFEIILQKIDDNDFQPRNGDERNQIQNFINTWKLISLLYASTVFGATTFMAIFPMFDDISDDEQRLPFISWFPYDYRKTPHYQLTYIYQIIAIDIDAFLTTTVDIFVASIIVIIAGQFSILCSRLREIYGITEERLMESGGITNNSEDRRALILDEMNETLKECIVYHWKILEFAKTVEELVDPVAMTQLITTVIVLCTTMFELTLVPIYSSEFVCLVFYQSSVICEIILYCWFGDRILTESGQIRNAIFESDWVDTPLTFKKNMLMLLRCTQQPLQMRAFGFFALSLPTFSGVVRLSWSYFVVLQQTQNIEH